MTRVFLSAEDVAAMRRNVGRVVETAGPPAHHMPSGLTATAALALIEYVEGLRAVLAPILEESLRGDFPCRFCGVIPGSGYEHDDDCPVRRADVLLGRVPAGESHPA